MKDGTRRNPDGAEPAQAGLSLRLLATTDLHGHLAGYDYFEDRPCIETGLARLASLIGTARAEAVNTLLLDNGDFLQGSPLVDYWARERGLSPGEVHPMIAAMNALCYDAVTVGNHEFNFGLDFTLRALDGAAFPVVSANAVQREGASPAEDETLFAPWVILERDLADAAGQARRLRIGVIGFLPPQTVLWDRALLSGLMSTRGIAEAARAHVPALRAAGADIVVALAHTGIAPEIAPDTPEHEIEDAALPLAEVEGIDVIVCGHTHALFPAPGLPPAPGLDPMRGTLCGKPAVLPGRWGSHLGWSTCIWCRAPRVAGRCAISTSGCAPWQSARRMRRSARWSKKTRSCAPSRTPRISRRCITSAASSASWRRRCTASSRSSPPMPG